MSTKICEIEAHVLFQNVPFSMKIGEIEAHFLFENCQISTKFCEIEAHYSVLENEQFSTKICEVEAHFFFEIGPRPGSGSGPRPGSGGSGDAKIAHALRASLSGGSPWIEQTRHVIHVFRLQYSSDF